MKYIDWFNAHAKKHKMIVQRVKKEFLIDYFCWDNISKTDIDFCPLFSQNKKCHDIKNLNCYLCACPNFRFDDDAKKVKSWCSINSKDGKQLKSKGVIHQDCSDCVIPHQKEYIQNNFDLDWLKIMKQCKTDKQDK